jgi:guanylate kinase
VFIAPPDPGALRQRLEARGTDSPEAIEARLRVAELELAARQEFPHVIVNDEIDRAAGELERVVRDELSLSSSAR